MPHPLRFVAPLAAALCLALTTACVFQARPEATPTPNPSAQAAAEAARAGAYSAAICPVFDAIVELDPRLAALRSAGANRVPEGVADEVDALIDRLGRLLEDLEAVPDWDAGANLRYQVESALHAIRARLLLIADDPTSNESLDDLAALPYIASDAMDLAFNQAFLAGYTCEDAT